MASAQQSNGPQDHFSFRHSGAKGVFALWPLFRPKNALATSKTAETFKKRDSWPLVLVQGRLSLGVRPWDIAHTRACGHGVLVGRFRERLNYGPSLRWGKDRAESAAFDASRRPRSDPSVCTT